MRKHYFAVDGSYGNAEGLVVVDTSDWTEEEWDAIDAAQDWERPLIAKSFSTFDPDQLEFELG